MLPGHKLCACRNRCGQANPSLNTYLKMGLHLLQQACMRLGSHDTWRMPVGCNGKLYSEAADTVDGIDIQICWLCNDATQVQTCNRGVNSYV